MNRAINAANDTIVSLSEYLKGGTTVDRYERLTDADRARVDGLCAGLLSVYGFDTMYKVLTPGDKQAVDSYITSLLQA